MNVGAIGAYAPYTSIQPYAAQNTAAIPNTMDPNKAAPVGKAENPQSPTSQKVDKSNPAYECQTCENRKYQDGSNEADVSFKAASKVAPEAAASAVRSHEQQHVSNAYQKAAEDNGKVISANVTIHTSICPECGKTYVSGGTTRTSIKYGNEENPYQKNLKNLQGGFLRGMNLDLEA